MVDIVTKDTPILRELAQTVRVEDIKTPKIEKIIRDMSEALAEQDDGVAIAAPQIGVPLRIFVASGSMLKKFIRRKDGENDKDVKIRKEDTKDMVFVNPEIIKLSKETKLMEEGCLSIRYLFGKVRRSTKATVRAYNEKGELFERGGSGLMAQIFQHETDHLNGILFTDKAVDVQDMPPEKHT